MIVYDFFFPLLSKCFPLINDTDLVVPSVLGFNGLAFVTKLLAYSQESESISQPDKNSLFVVLDPNLFIGCEFLFL